MVRALPGQGISLHPRRKAADGPAVFDSEVVVGLVQQGGDPLVRCKLRRGGLPRGGKAPCAARKLGFQDGAVGVAVKKLGGLHQKGRVGRLGTEHQTVAPSGGKQRHARPGERLCPRAGTGSRQSKHKVSPAGEGGPGADSFGQEGQRPSLH